MTEARDPDFDAIDEQSIWEEARDRDKIWAAMESHNNNLAKADQLFREGENHWNNDYVTTESEAQPELVINFTDTLVTRVVNSISEREPRGKCHPIGDGADEQKADTINGIGRHIEYRSEASVAYDYGVDNATTFGWGWWRLLTEWETPKSFNKEIRISPIMNAFSVHADPASIMPTACDMQWCIVSDWMARTEYKRKYPQAENRSWSDVGSDYSIDWETKEQIRIAQYFRIRETKDTLYHLVAPPGPSLPNGMDVTVYKKQLPIPAFMQEFKVKIQNERPAERQQVEMFTLNGVKVVAREILPGSWIPIIRCQGNAKNIDGKMYRRGMVRFLQDPQRMVDYGEVAKIKRLGLTPQSPWVVAEGQLDGHPEWEDSHLTYRPILTYKPVAVTTGQGEQVLPPPMRQPPAQVEAGFTEFVQGMRSNLLAIAGMPNEPGQDDQTGTTVSGKAIQRRDKLSDQSHSQYYKNQKLAIAHTWRIMLEWIPHYYSEERMQRIIGEDGKPQMLKINEQVDGTDEIRNDMTVGRYDVVMDAGPSYETMREEGSERLMEIMDTRAMGEIVAKTAPDLVMRSMDFQYAEEIADRLAAQTPDGLKKIMDQMPKQAKAVIQSLAQQNQQLKQALQQAEQEAKFGLAKAHLAATVKAHDVEESNKTKRADTESRERTTIHKTNLDNVTKLHIEEIAAGAELLNTHVEAAHHKEAAELELKTAEKAEKSNGAA
jgi:Phage P22-like portal protein